jgi:hypothetical protein
MTALQARVDGLASRARELRRRRHAAEGLAPDQPLDAFDPEREFAKDKAAPVRESAASPHSPKMISSPFVTETVAGTPGSKKPPWQ